MLNIKNMYEMTKEELRLELVRLYKKASDKNENELSSLLKEFRDIDNEWYMILHTACKNTTTFNRYKKPQLIGAILKTKVLVKTLAS